MPAMLKRKNIRMAGVKLSELDNSKRRYMTDRQEGAYVRPLNQFKDLGFNIEMEKHFTDSDRCETKSDLPFIRVRISLAVLFAIK